MGKSLMVLARRPPHGSTAGADLLDVVLAAGAFEQTVSLVFLDDGVFQALSGQSPGAIGARDFAKTFGALADYGVDDVVVERDSLEERGLKEGALLAGFRVIDRADLRRRLAAADVVIGL